MVRMTNMVRNSFVYGLCICTKKLLVSCKFWFYVLRFDKVIAGTYSKYVVNIYNVNFDRFSQIKTNFSST